MDYNCVAAIILDMTEQITAEDDADIRRTEGMQGSSEFDCRTFKRAPAIAFILGVRH